MTRGRAKKVKDPQRSKLVEKFGARWLVVGANTDQPSKNKKNAILNEALAWVYAKLGSKDPWRTLSASESADLETAVVDGEEDADPAPVQEKVTQYRRIRKDINMVLTYHLKATEAGLDPQVAAQKEAEDGRKVIVDLLQSTRVAPRKMAEHAMFKLKMRQPEWDAEIRSEIQAKEEAAQAQGKSKPLDVNVEREWLIKKYKATDQETKNAIRAAVEAHYHDAMADFERTLDPKTESVDDVERFISDVGPFLQRLVEVVSLSVKGCVCLLVGAPEQDEDGKLIADVTRWEHTAIPTDLDEDPLQYSDIDIEAFNHVVRRFKRQALLVSRINFAPGQEDRAVAYDKLRRWQESVAAKRGVGFMGSQSSRDGSTHEASAGGLHPQLPGHVHHEDEEDDYLNLVNPPSGAASPQPNAIETSPQKRAPPRFPSSPRTDGSYSLPPSPKSVSEKRVLSGGGGASRDVSPTGTNDAPKTPPAQPDNLRRSSPQSFPDNRDIQGGEGAMGAGRSAEESAGQRSGDAPKTPPAQPDNLRRSSPQSFPDNRDIQGGEGAMGAGRNAEESAGQRSADLDGFLTQGAGERALGSQQEIEKRTKESRGGVQGANVEDAGGKEVTETRSAAAHVSVFRDWEAVAALEAQNPKVSFGSAIAADRVNKSQDVQELRDAVAAELNDVVRVPGIDATFASRGKPGAWTQFVEEAVKRAREWACDERLVLEVVRAYVEFERQLPKATTRVGLGWSAFPLHGEEDQIRPTYLRTVLPRAQYKVKWCPLAARGEAPSVDGVDWNLGSALSIQWARLQPKERRDDEFIAAAPSADMVWGLSFAGGKQGVRLLILGLLLWADALGEIRDGTTVQDWNDLAADMALVLRVRAEQEKKLAEERVAKESTSAGPSDGTKRERPKTLKQRLLDAEKEAAEKEGGGAKGKSGRGDATEVAAKAKNTSKRKKPDSV
ncbi:unnamed protein product [Peniophora sp. CBMAI 1063]|nr:unnamed protein product [Peniophora sp. CBMAI 1063]